jgi:hypothetical protein
MAIVAFTFAVDMLSQDSMWGSYNDDIGLKEVQGTVMAVHTCVMHCLQSVHGILRENSEE